MIIGFAGKKGSGKDTCCQQLSYNLSHCVTCSFASLLKKNIAMDILGLSREQCYGNEKDKNSLTELKWENMPTRVPKIGLMTAREVLQYIGTDLFRTIDKNIWVNALLRIIDKREKMLDPMKIQHFTLISDVRFISEVEGIHMRDGIVIKLCRAPYQDDIHSSENELNDYTNFDYVLQNDKMSLGEQRKMMGEFADSLRKSRKHFLLKYKHI